MPGILTVKAEVFCRNYLASGNATQAYIDSYDAAHLRRQKASEAAYELRQRPDIQARIEQLQRDIEGRFVATQGERRQVLWEVAESNQAEKPDTTIKAIGELNRMDPELRNPSISIEPQQPMKIRFHPSLDDQGKLER